MISLLEAALACVLASWLCSVLRSESTLRWTMEVVMRMGYSPTLPVRLMRTSSISSIVDMARAEAW